MIGKAASYILSAYSFIFDNTLDKVLDVGYEMKEGNPIPSFDEDILIELCSEIYIYNSNYFFSKKKKKKNIRYVRNVFILYRWLVIINIINIFFPTI